MQMPGRFTNSGDYRYGYNGMEKDKEIKGDGNSYTTEFRQYDPRLGRWLSLDPLMMMFPDMSPYVAFDNNPIYYNDPYGLASQAGDGDKLEGDPPPGSGGTSESGNGSKVTISDEENEIAVGIDYSNFDIESPECTITAQRPKSSDEGGFFSSFRDYVNSFSVMVAKFTFAAAHTWASNNVGGANRIQTNDAVLKSGRFMGDLLTIAQSVGELIVGGGTAGTGMALSAAGPLVVVGAPVTAAGVTLTAHGSVLLGSTVSSMVNDKVNDDNADNQNGGSGTESGNSSKAKIDDENAGHIFKDKEGHLTQDTPGNRKLLEDTVNDRDFLGVDQHGNTWHSRTLSDGSQVWTSSRGGKITNGGVNAKGDHRAFDPQKGLAGRKFRQ